MNFAYAVEKLSDTVRTLATHPGDIKTRLKEATTDSFVRLSEGNIPAECRAEYLNIHQKLTSTPSIGKEGNFYASIDAMSEEQAVKLAEAILNLEEIVTDMWENS